MSRMKSHFIAVLIATKYSLFRGQDTSWLTAHDLVSMLAWGLLFVRECRAFWMSMRKVILDEQCKPHSGYRQGPTVANIDPVTRSLLIRNLIPPGFFGHRLRQFGHPEPLSPRTSALAKLQTIRRYGDVSGQDLRQKRLAPTA